MPPEQKIKVRGESDITTCPTCGFPVRIVRRAGGYADHYKYIEDRALEQSLAPQDPETAAKLRELRKGKKTVAVVGMATSTCALAPYDDLDVDIWCLNEMHAFPWCKRATGWFQIHPREIFEREVAVRNVEGHFDWLKEKHGFPIWMQFKYDDIPDSVEFPLHDICERFFGNVRKGDAKWKHFSSGFNYMIAMALYQNYERIEIYGFEMSGQDEYAPQRPGAYLWLGIAMGLGVEIYLPPNNQMLLGALYGYKGSFNGRAWEGHYE